MSTPYERLLQSATPRSSRPSQNGQPSSSVRPGGSNGPGSSSQLSAKKQMTVKRSKPNISFFVRPRYRFELPDPPMDPKMLLGTLSTRSYAEPFVSDLEREFRSAPIPADPTYALRANLSIPAVPRASTAPPHKLTIDDDALLQSVVNSQSISSKLRTDNVSMHRPSGSSVPSSIGPPVSTQMQASSVSNAPWMRRMSYDEYISRTGTKRSTIPVIKPKALIKKPEKDAAHNFAMKEKRRKQLMATFTLIRNRPTHPDSRKTDLKPVSISPVFLDFSSVGNEFIMLNFDKDDLLTHEDRVKEDHSAAEESVRSMASVSLGDGTTPRRGETPKKYIACYTPTDATLEKRTRKRGDDEDMDENDLDSDNKNSTRRKIHFVEEEEYEWIGEYVIREGKYAEHVTLQDAGSRSCFAVCQHASKVNKQRVTCLTRIGTSWKLSRKPIDETVGRLGKEGLRLNRVSKAAYEAGEELRRNILHGNLSAHKRSLIDEEDIHVVDD